ncbi:MAG: DUF3611 family protein [Chroococcales cyanobacterium]
MRNKTGLPTSIPPAIQRVANDMTRVGRIGFWTQIVLGVLALVATTVGSFSDLLSQEDAPQGASSGLFFAICSLITLAVAVYFCFRYVGIGKLLRSEDASQRPSKGDTIREIRLAISVNLIGMILSIVGAQAITGATLIKIFTIPQAAVAVERASRFVQPVDLVVIQANVTTITAHFCGFVISLWLLNKITK